MAYSETRIVIGGLAHVPVLIFIANFIKGKFGIKTEETKDTLVKEEPFKICVFIIYLAFLSLISLLISNAITTTHMFIRNTSNGIF